MSSYKTVAHDGPLFEAMMQEIDAQLTREGHPIEDRPIFAGREVSLLHGVTIPFGNVDARRLPPDVAPYAPLGAAIMRWYDELTGTGLKST